MMRAAKYAIPACLLLGVLSGCNTAKFLEEGDYLLETNRIKVRGELEDRGDMTYDLSTFFRQEPNTNWLFLFPREWFYFKTEGKEASFARWQRRALGEPPAIYNDSLTQTTAESMSLYLQYKGYFQAEVLAQGSPRRRRMKVTYYVLPGERYRIDSVFFNSPDPRMDSLLQEIKPESVLRRGQPMDLQLLNQEKERISIYLRNHGYANFFSNYFDQLEIDTFQRSRRANLYLNILPPFEDTLHPRYFIGEINVFTDFDPSRQNIVRDTVIAGLRFFLSDQGFIVNPNTLREAISLRPGEQFSQEDFDRTNNQLSALGIYRFVRIKQSVDTLTGQFLNFNIQLTPNSRMALGAYLDINYTNRSISAGTGNLLGLSFSPSYRHRNLLGGAELFLTNLTAGVEVNPVEIRSQRFWNTIDLRLEGSLFMPDFQDYLAIWRRLRRFSLISSNLYSTLRRQANTRVSASYNYLLILDWYRYNLLNLSYGYEYQPSQRERLSINHFAVNVLLPRTELNFDTLLADNPFLARSFGQQVFVSLLFRDVDFLRQGRVNRRGISWFFNGKFEIAGAEVWAANKLYNAVAEEPLTFRLGSTNFSQYLLAETDVRWLKQLPSEQSLAMRLNIGLTRPFGFTSDVPYVKQFYVGGANSMRAWAPRGLGPGGYLDSTSLETNNNLRLYQTGDFKLELNAEYRFNLFWRIGGAFFIDAGNVWTVREDKERPGAQFRLGETIGSDGNVHYPFYKQIAVAGGFGLRVDLSFFLFRFDVGLKLRNNYPRVRTGDPPESAWWNDLSPLTTQDFGFNLGLGLPF